MRNESIVFRMLLKSPQELSKGSVVDIQGDKCKITSINKVEFISYGEAVVIGKCKKVEENVH